MKNKFWNWIKNEGWRELRLEGVIADSTWYGDEVTPELFRDELNSGNDNITVWINSYGGDCFAASQIYTMLKDYPAEVTVKIDGVAASAASVIAMAGDKVLMSPTSVIMIHNPATIAAGDSDEMKAAIRMLDEVKESIINAYELKTGLSREFISRLMDSETWLNAKKAVEMKFADDILFAENSKGYEVEDAVIYSRAMVTNSLLDRIKTKKKSERLDAAQLNKQTFKFNQVGEIKMADIQELRDKRLNLWNEAKKFLDGHTDNDGTISADDAATYEKMESDIINLGKSIERLERQAVIDATLSAPASKPILTDPRDSANFFDFGGTPIMQTVNKTTSDYGKAFWQGVRKNFKTVSNLLQETVDIDGGFLLPSEFHDQLVTELEQENIMRQLGTVIQTQSQHKVNVVANRPSASWIGEGQAINFDDETFSQVSLDAYKLAVGIKISNELLTDSYYDLENHFVEEFGKVLANAEEDAFINGQPSASRGMPTGIIPTLTANSDCCIATEGATIAPDDLLSTIYSLPRAYRKNASWLMHDSTLEKVRKLKDGNLAFVWQPSYQAGEPDRLLGYPVYTSAYFPANVSSVSSSAVIAAFGDFSRYFIADRATRQFRPLRELYATNDITAFLMIERVDGKLIDTKALKLLKMR